MKFWYIFSLLAAYLLEVHLTGEGNVLLYAVSLILINYLDDIKDLLKKFTR